MLAKMCSFRKTDSVGIKKVEKLESHVRFNGGRAIPYTPAAAGRPHPPISSVCKHMFQISVLIVCLREHQLKLITP